MKNFMNGLKTTTMMSDIMKETYRNLLVSSIWAVSKNQSIIYWDYNGRQHEWIVSPSFDELHKFIAKYIINIEE